MIPTAFIELTIIIILAVLISIIMRILRQPLIIGYIITGIVVGPFFLNVVKSADTISLFSQIGVAFLLFAVGLNLNPKLIKDIGKVSLVTGIGQVVFTSLIGFIICRALGLSVLISAYISVAITFSSTIIIMKLLSDKKDLETLYGRIAIGFLIVQDVIAILVLFAVSSLSSRVMIENIVISSLVKAIVVIALLFMASVYVLPKVTKFIACSQELLLLFSIAWCFSVAILFYLFNFSIEAGALIAGISLSMLPYHYEISSKIRPLRDFFIILFFILLGSQMIFGNISQYLFAAVILTLFILIGNPIIVIILMGLLGYTKRNSFMAGLTVAQISEFSLILIALGVRLGHLSGDILSLVTVVGLATIGASTYMIMYSEKLYAFFSRYLSIFEKKENRVDEHKHTRDRKYEIFLFGYNRIGFDVLHSLKKLKKKIAVIDYDPDTVITLAKQGYECRYGDASDIELLNDLDFSKTKMVISTIPEIETNLVLINYIHETNKKCIIVVVSHQVDEALSLYEAGASYVIMPHFLGGKHIAAMIEKNRLSVNSFIKEKILHMEHLKTRKQMGHEHPKHENQ
jgi:Kef-type K+ transport system membrane component KefB/Trk K+ transport system NAD-binding subunit